MSGLTWLVKTVRRAPLFSIAVTFLVVLLCWGGAWVLQEIAYVPTILLILSCASVVLLIGISVYVLVDKVERKN